MAGLPQAAESKGFVGAGNGARTCDFPTLASHTLKEVTDSDTSSHPCPNSLGKVRFSPGFESRRPDHTNPREFQSIKT